MELIIDRMELAKTLGVVGKALASRSMLPVLKSFALSAEEFGLRISATDLEVHIRQMVKADVRKAGALCVGPLFAEFVGRASRDEATISQVGDRLHVVCGRDSAKFPTIPIDEFPVLSDDIEEVCLITSGVVTDLVKRVVFCAAKDESRPILTGVNIQMSGGRLTLAAADGFRLAVASAPVSNDLELQGVIPARAMSLLSAFQSGDLRIGVRSIGDISSWRFSADELEINAQIIMGRYPDYSQIIPAQAATTVTANQQEMLRACHITNLFARSAANIVKLELGEGTLVVAGETAEVGDGRSELEAEIEGPPLTIAFNGAYLIDALSAMDDERVVLTLNNAESPGVIRPDSLVDQLCVIMPMNMAK